jgi:hypothetical protein
VTSGSASTFGSSEAGKLGGVVALPWSFVKETLPLMTASLFL